MPNHSKFLEVVSRTNNTAKKNKNTLTMDLGKAAILQFYINDKKHSVKFPEVKPSTSLNTYLRKNAYLTGTKFMCKEGGCGACIVFVINNKNESLAVNSCLIPIFLCSNWNVYTVEGLGDAKNGYNKIQTTLANFNGSQCGFCSPGMVMTMYSLLKKNDNKVTMEEMEHSFGGNLCRCTGYRPIMTAFKTLCVDADKNLIGKYPEFDIEDLHFCPAKENSMEKCFGEESFCKIWPENKQEKTQNPENLDIQVGSSKWYKASSINDIFQIFASNPSSRSYQLICGNTAQGVYPPPVGFQYDHYIDITNVTELFDSNLSEDKLILGANMSLTSTIELFDKISAENPNFRYLSKLSEHINLVANVPVRNIGSLAGNLMIKHEHNEFPSDIFLLLTTVKAELLVAIPSEENVGIFNYLTSFVSQTGYSEITMGMQDFLSFDMDRKVIKNIILPAYDTTYFLESYKIMPRAENAHAHVNAGFLLQLNGSTVKSARIIYGGINPTFVRATATEKFLKGKDLFDNNNLQGAYKSLESEVIPDNVLPNPPPEFRKFLAISLFYKFVLSVCPSDKLTPDFISGGEKLKRGVSSGVQDFQTNQSLYPLGQPIPKLEALAQTSGGAEYINDIPEHPEQLFGVFVTAESPAYSVIKSIDTSKALKLDGVVAYFDKKDVPGTNSFNPIGTLFPNQETLFCKGTVEYYHQPVGVIVANNEETARLAASLIKIDYIKGIKKPLLTVRDILKSGNKSKLANDKDIPRSAPKGTDIKHVIKGTFDIYHQYHFHMETQICTVVPVEDGLDMFASTQTIDINQVAAAMACNIPVNRVNVTVRRIGGGYGGKVTRNSLVSTATAVAAYLLQKPVKMFLTLSENIKLCGGRYPCSMDYEVGTDDQGIIQYLDSTLWNNFGCGRFDSIPENIVNSFLAKYKTGTWQVSFNTAFADTAAGTFTRAPGTTEGEAAIESIMEHISFVTNRDPVDLRLDNIDPEKEPEMVKFINELVDWADIRSRQKEIEDFNKNNRWMKKGLSIVPNDYGFTLFGRYPALVSIFHGDGSVGISHGGIEMGQGINTKVAQVCAFNLGIPVDKISVKPSNNLVSANGWPSGGSITSEAVCYAVTQCCKVLIERIDAVRKDLPAGTSWEKVIKECYDKFVDLTATYMYSPLSPDIKSYNIYGVCATEVLVDILTGNHLIMRVDILEDTGDSMNPLIDIGQVEGAYMMGVGYYTSEEFITTKEGKILTNRTWNYKVPVVKDIPVDFRVKFPSDNPNPVGVFNSKATAEPPLNLSVGVPLAIRRAVASARTDADEQAPMWFRFDGPTTVPNTLMNSLSSYNQYTL